MRLGRRRGAGPTITVANQEDGVARTTAAVNRSAALAVADLETLLGEVDPRANASVTLPEPDSGLASMFDGLTWVTGEARSAEITASPKFALLAAAPSRIALATLARQLLGDLDAYYRLRDRIRCLRESFGFVRIDTSPTSGLISVNMLVARDCLLAPLPPGCSSPGRADDLPDSLEQIRGRADRLWRKSLARLRGAKRRQIGRAHV